MRGENDGRRAFTLSSHVKRKIEKKGGIYHRYGININVRVIKKRSDIAGTSISVAFVINGDDSHTSFPVLFVIRSLFVIVNTSPSAVQRSYRSETALASDADARAARRVDRDSNVAFRERLIDYCDA